MTRQTKRLLGFLTVLVLFVGGASYVALRSKGPSTVAVADLSAGASKSAASTAAATEAAAASTSAVPSVSPTASVTATATSSAAKAKITAKAKQVAKAQPKAATTAVTVTKKSVKKGASVWNQKGIKQSLADSGVSWDYDWAVGPNGVARPKGVEFVPMAWGAASVNAASLATAKQNGKTLLGFNEPDMGGQANMTVAQALNLWPQLEATKMRLGSPAVAWGADQSGQWLDKFMTGAKSRGYRVDFIPLHWYGSDFTTAAAVSQLKAYVKATYARYHKPIWITEYALMNFSGSPKLPTASQQAAFVKASTAMLQKLSYVERYAWFAFPTSTDGTDGTGLYRPGNIPTLAGEAYRAAG